MNYLEKVKKFHSVFGHPISESPNLTNKERNNLRLDLISEEWHELQEALDNKNVIEVLDALCDIQYVLSGAILELGFKDIFNEAFRRVHESNMSKACKTIEEAEETVRAYLKDGVRAYFEEVNGLYIVYRKQDNKVLKSINYKKVDLDDLI